MAKLKSSTKATPQTYALTVDLKVTTSLNVIASSFADALEAANNLTVTDYITFKGDYIDGEFPKLNGIYCND